MNYAVGHNMPGYLPESDVEIFTEWEDAKRYLIDIMERDADFYDDTARQDGNDENDERHDLAESLSSECEDLNLDNGPEWGTIVGNVSYWIMLTDEEPEEEE